VEVQKNPDYDLRDMKRADFIRYWRRSGKSGQTEDFYKEKR